MSLLPALFTLWGRLNQSYEEYIMLNFEEELKKFKPSLEIEDAEEIIYNQDIDDMSDVLVKLLKDAKKESESQLRNRQ